MRKIRRGNANPDGEPLSAGRVEYLEAARARVRAKRIRRTVVLVTALTLMYSWFRKPMKQLIAREQQQEEDLAILTWAFLQNAHDNYTRQGWCTAAEKEQVLNMHKSYAAKGRNHLSASYEQDILALPETPPEGRRSK